ncbi:hypothetical protein HJC23_003723 [Cyclotella cryptica]|uniref:L domain-like protein n=1 Tax=Cyclotella cryptica TaxID=29204 RepID=A0ABD3QUU8_9STRA
MTEPSSNTNRHDADSHVGSAANTAANGGENPTSVRYQTVLDQLNKAPKFTDEWFRLKEEELQLRSQHDFALVIDNGSAVNGGELDDIRVGKGHHENVVTLEGDRYEISHDSSSSPSVGKSSNEDGHTPSVIADDFSARSCAGTTANEADSLNLKGKEEQLTTKMHMSSLPAAVRSSASKPNSPHANAEKNEMVMTGHIKSLTTKVQPSHDVVVKLHPIHSSAITEAPIHTFDVSCDEPRSLHSNTFQDTKKSNERTSIETSPIADDECPLPQIGIRLAGSVISEKLSGFDAAVDVKSKQSAISEVQLTSPSEADDPNRDESLLVNEVLMRRTMFSELNRNDGRHMPPRAIHQASSLSMAHANSLSQYAPNEHRRGEEGDDEAIVIPEAFLVTEDLPLQVAIVGVAEQVQTGQRRISLKRHHAYFVLIFVAATAITVGVTLGFSRRNKSLVTIVETETPSSLLPSFQPSFGASSSYSSVVAPTSQPLDSTRYEVEKSVLERNATFGEMESSNARVLALDWITDKDQMKLVPSSSNFVQRYVLALLAFEFASQKWLSTLDECKWFGVAYGYYLDGTMPPEIGRLSYLQALSLTDNILHGTLPSEICKLGKLIALNLTNNEFRGTLPTEVGYLTSLRNLYIADNQFTGQLPKELGLLSSLTELQVDGNQFIGELPSQLGLLASLTGLWVYDNQFDGTLPTELGLLTSLRVLSLDGNKFTGTLPSELGLLASLTKLFVYDNQFRGTLPSELGLLASLTLLSVDGNQLTGMIPPEIGLMLSLMELYVDNNQFTGTLPSELGFLTSLTELHVYDNQFTGTLPSELGFLTSLAELHVDGNQFRGRIPSELGFLTLLRSFTIPRNQFTGTLPSDFEKLVSLTELTLRDNQLTGTFPSQIKGLFELSKFHLSSNQFVGTLPSWIGDLKGLQSLWIDDNHFNGTLPSELQKLTSLTSLDISGNELTGTFPTWIGDFQLSDLWLQDNQFTGTFPSEIENNLDLVDFCLSNNMFTGSLPKEIETLWTCTQT